MPIPMRTTRDVDEAARLVSQLAPGMDTRPLGPGFSLGVQGAATPRMRIFRMDARELRFVGRRRGFFGGTLIVEGSVEIADGVLDAVYDDRYAHVVPDADTLFDVRIPDWTIGFGVTIDPELMAALADRLGVDPVEGARRIDLRSGDASSLRRHLLFTWRELERGGLYARTPPAALPLEEMLGTQFLVAAQPAPEEGAGPSAVSRAIGFLDSRLARPVTVGEVAAAAGLSERTLHREFRRECGAGPMAWFRQRRLEAAREALIAADPASATVTGVAVRFGFHNQGRFSAAYRQLFSELPSETLRGT